MIANLWRIANEKANTNIAFVLNYTQTQRTQNSVAANDEHDMDADEDFFLAAAAARNNKFMKISDRIRSNYNFVHNTMSLSNPIAPSLPPLMCFVCRGNE